MTLAKFEVCEILQKFYQFVHLMFLLPEALEFKTSVTLDVELTKLEKMSIKQTGRYRPNLSQKDVDI